MSRLTACPAEQCFASDACKPSLHILVKCSMCCHYMSHFKLFVQALGAAGLTKRPTSILMVLPKPLKGAVDDDEAKEFAESYEAVRAKISSIEPLYMRR